MNENGYNAFPAALWQTVLVVLAGSVVGLAVNGLRAEGIPLKGTVRVVHYERTPPVRNFTPMAEDSTVEQGMPESEAVESAAGALAAVVEQPPAVELPPEPKPEPEPESGPEPVETTGVAVFSPVAVEEPEGGAQALDLDQTVSFFNSGEAVFVDARNRDEFVVGHIPGSFSLPYDEMEMYLDVLNYLPEDGLVVTYCDGSDCHKSLDLADELTAMGFTRVRVFFAGWEAWQEAGEPVEEGEPLMP